MGMTANIRHYSRVMQQLPEPISVCGNVVKTATHVTIMWIGWLMTYDEDSWLLGSMQISRQPGVQRIIDIAATICAVLIQNDEVSIIVIEGEGSISVTASWTPINIKGKGQRLIMTFDQALIVTIVIANSRNQNHIVTKRSL
jgi:hypothetical protein